MPRGENKEFRKQQESPLTLTLMENAIRWKLDSFDPDIDTDSLDLESLIDSTLTFSENWKNIRSELEGALDTSESMDEDLLEHELERYEYQWEKYCERHGIEVQVS